MRALVIHGPGKTSVADVREPELREGEVLLQVRRVGMCGTDLNSFRGKNPLISFPRIPGHEIAATVVNTHGSGGALRAGMNVTVSPYTSCGKCASCLNHRPNACQFNQTLGVQRDGAMTEFISVPAAKIFIAEGLSAEELCLVEPLSVGFHASARARITGHDKVAVFGCGGVGLGAIAGAAFRGGQVIAIDVDDAKLKLALKAGAMFAINSQTEVLHDRLQELTDGLGPSVMIEAVGRPETFRAAVEEVAFTGRVVYIGYAKEPVSYETRLFVMKELDILGSRNALPDDFEEVIRMMQEHRFPVDDTVSRIVPLEDAGEALGAWSNDPSAYSKILVRVSG